MPENNTVVIPNVQLPVGAVPSPQSTTAQAVLDLQKQAVSTPTLPAGTQITPQLQQVQTGEQMTTTGLPTTAPTAVAPTMTPAQAQAVTAPTAQVVQDPAALAAAQYTATTVGTAPTMTAAQGQVTAPAVAAQGMITSEATVTGQLEELQQQVTDAIAQGKPLPAWASGAERLVQANMAQRGLSASTMYAEALATGIMNAATPIAAQDAQAYKDMIFQNLNNRQQAAVLNAQQYFQMDMANLSNEQQANLQNLQARQAQLFSDQAAQNAALQFNATSENQVNQFFKSLQTQVKTNNAQRIDAMNSLAMTEANKIEALNAQNVQAANQANAQIEASINQFNSTLQDSRQRFNVENQRIIDQSNVEWRRAINTANTAAVNAANQTNAANLLGISNFALSSLWQQWRDEASWTNEAAQNNLNRLHNMAVAALEQQTAFDLADQSSRDSLFELLGGFAAAIFSS